MSQRTLSFPLLAAVALVGTALPLAPAHAADLDYNYGDAPPPVAETKVEFGSGWYVRGDIGATRLPNVSSTIPTLPTAGNLTAPDAPSILIGRGSDVGYDASLGAGYQVNHWFRTDIVGDFHQPVKNTTSTSPGAVFCPTGVSYPYETINNGVTNYGPQQFATGSCTGNYNSTIRSYDVLVNAYIDIGTWYRVTPYVGAGVGLSFGHYQTSATYVQGNGVPYGGTFNDPQFGTQYLNYNRSGSGTYYNLAWALMSGFAVDIYDHTKLDIGYRYLNLGRIPGSSGTLYDQEVRAGLRYMVDN